MKINKVAEFDVATGGDPTSSLMEALMPYSAKPHVLEVAVAHDDECLCIGNQNPMLFCSCEIVHVSVKRVA